MVINTEPLLLCGWRQPAPSYLTTFDEVGNIYPLPPLFFPGETEIKLSGLGLVNYLQGHSCRNVPHSAQGEDAVKKTPLFPLVTVLSPLSAKSALPWGWTCTPPGRGYNADSNSTFFLHSFQLQKILLSPITVPAISPISHTFYSRFFFS